GAGPAGLSAMPELRIDDAGLRWLRPLLDVPRAAVDVYVRLRGLSWIDDDSNVDSRHARNALRLAVVPRLAAMAPGYPATIARSASLQAEAMRLADDLAAQDVATAYDGETLDRTRLAGLDVHRARNVLRWFLRQRGLPPPSSGRLDAMLR